MAKKESRERKIRITVDIYSGRENPTIELTDKKLATALELMKPRRPSAPMDVSEGPVPTLGYRGMIVEQTGAPIDELPQTFRVAGGLGFSGNRVLRVMDPAFEDFVCGTVPKPFPIEDLREEILAFRELRDFHHKWHWKGQIFSLSKPCKCAPVYEPSWWNTADIQPVNNCYNYSTNYRTNTFAQPGRAAGSQYGALTCAEVRPAAVADKLIDNPGADNKCPKNGHLVALVVWPNHDYHWYRKGTDGLWTHKPGSTAVTNLDNSGNPITDPRTADRGGYSDFCTFMTVKHGHIMIR